MGRHYEVRAASMQKTANAKAKVYSRFGKEIYLAAKAGLPDPEMNVTLKRVIAQAKSNQVPADVISRAIDKAKGGSTDNYDSARYEGFGPGQSTIIVDCLTDNVNRTIADVRTAFNRAKAKIGVNGSVSFMYDHVGLFVFDTQDSEKILESLLENEIDVIDLEEDEHINLTVAPNQFHEARDVLDTVLGENVEYLVNEITLLPQSTCSLDNPEERELFVKLITMLEDVDDVQNVYHNVENV
ncbi:MAG: YebC/PmpR family DNA-binding transcriptional regulator [Erysipelothrix sp.]|nr:YebC/PmpR family DNA-binding transcriptional regulator [Erysipelothrix sp.]